MDHMGELREDGKEKGEEAGRLWPLGGGIILYSLQSRRANLETVKKEKKSLQHKKAGVPWGGGPCHPLVENVAPSPEGGAKP